MPDLVEFPEIAITLRRLLKERKITYRRLARELDISESSVKKQFISRDCSLSRLSRICSVLGIDLLDLLEARKEMPARKFRFSEAQEKLLLESEQCFLLYWKIVYEERSAETARAELGISETACFRQLRALDQVGLIELLPGGRLRRPDMSMTLWENSGPLVAKVMKEWPQKLLKLIQDHRGEDGYHIALRIYKLCPETQRELVKALEEILLEFGRRSVRESRMHPRETKDMGLVLGVAPRSFIS